MRLIHSRSIHELAVIKAVLVKIHHEVKKTSVFLIGNEGVHLCGKFLSISFQHQAL